MAARTAAAAVAAAALVLTGCGSGSPAPPGSAPSAASSTGPNAASSPASGTAPSRAAASPAAPATGPVGPSSAAGTWPGYHADQARSGAVGSGPPLAPATRAWSADLGAAVRGQAVVADGRVIAATEGDRVVALDPATGGIQWSTSVGRPLRGVASAAGCGDVDPLGITSTPVVDTATHTVYVVGEVDDGGGSVHHQLVGLDVATGAVRLSVAADPPLAGGERAVHLLQRAGLALGGGRVYIAYGGNAGDCGRYHGWVVGVDVAHPDQQVSFQVAPGAEGGAIWQSGGAPALDAAGNLYVSTGNADPDPPRGGPDPGRYTESVVALSPDLQPLASFKDRTAGGDDDLSTGNPVLLDGGTVLAVGKTDTAYLLRQGDLSRVAAVRGVCGSDPDGGPAYDRASGRVFVPCRGGGLQVVDVVRRALGPRLRGADSAPVLVGTHLWALDHAGGTLHAYDAASGREEQHVVVGADVPVFTSPSVGAGVLLVGTTTGVTAFR